MSTENTKRTTTLPNGTLIGIVLITGAVGALLGSTLARSKVNEDMEQAVVVQTRDGHSAIYFENKLYVVTPTGNVPAEEYFGKSRQFELTDAYDHAKWATEDRANAKYKAEQAEELKRIRDQR